MAGKEKTPADFLKEVSLFDGMSDNILSEIFKLGKVKSFKGGETIIQEGAPGGNLHVMIEGRAEVLKSGKELGEKKYLSDMNRGSIFGEMSVFDDAPYSASVKARVACSVHIVKGSDFKKFLKKNPEVAYDVFCTLISLISSRLRRANLAYTLLDN